MLKLVPGSQASFGLGEGTHPVPPSALAAAPVAKDGFISGLTDLFIRVSCHCLAAAYDCNKEKARGLGRRHFVLVCVLFSAA